MYRIGIDVGGTFTDAIAIDTKDLCLIGIVKIPTTHHHPNGVSEGIRIALQALMEQYKIRTDEVAFIAHGTTQATNALLEGDVVPIAVISYSKGFGAFRVKKETMFNQLKLMAGKKIAVSSFFIKDLSPAVLSSVFQEIKKKQIKSVVASTAYSVDDPSNEKHIYLSAVENGLNCTTTHEMSSLYGLRTRTKTAIINASILPKMIDTTNYLVESVRLLGIVKPLMIMRSDGGVMSVAEMKKRPIQTILSGPAASVAGALLYGKISQGIFLEVGGTSTDISVIRNSKVMVKWAQIGSHKTYVNSLDIHTVAIAGGSMLRRGDSGIICGPRSAHIAGLQYCSFADDLDVRTLQVEEYNLPQDEVSYFVLKDTRSQKKYAITVTCLANYTKQISAGCFAEGNSNNVRVALQMLSVYFKKTADKIIDEVYEDINKRLSQIIEELISTYRLSLHDLNLIGGGGGCDAVVPVLAKYMKLPYTRCQHAEAIAPIGVAMAMVREVCERTIISPTQQDLVRLTEEAIAHAVTSGASRNHIEVFIETDPLKNIVRAIATGVTDSSLLVNSHKKISRHEMLDILLTQEKLSEDSLFAEVQNNYFSVFSFQKKNSCWWKQFFVQKTSPLYVMENDGTIKLRKKSGKFAVAKIADISQVLNKLIDDLSEYGDIGEKIPEIFLIIRDKIIDYSMIKEREQVLNLASFEAKQYEFEEKIILVAGL